MTQQEPEQILIVDDEVYSDSTTVDTPPFEQDVEEKSIKLVSRIGSIPVVYDITNKTTLGRFAVSTASSTLSTVNKYQPKYIQSYYEYYIQPHVEKADKLGCRSLDLIQEKYPVVNQSTSEILYNVTAPSYQLIDKSIAPVIDSFEVAIDKYLPSPKEETKLDADNQVVRAYYLISNATVRLSQRTRATEFIQKVQDLQTQLAALAQPSFVAQKAQSIQQSTQEKIALITQQVLAQLNDLLQESPEWLKSPVFAAANVAQKQIDIVRREYEREDIKTTEKAKHVAWAIQEQLVPVLQQAKSHLLQKKATTTD